MRPRSGDAVSDTHRPRVALDEDFPFFILVRADLQSLRGDPAQVPLAVPEFPFARCANFLCHRRVLLHIIFAAEMLCRLDKRPQRPVMHERHHGALAAAQVQAIVPVGAQPFADSRLPHLLRGKIQRALQMLVNRRLAFIGESHYLVEQRGVARLFHVLANRHHDPQRIVRACVVDSVNQALAIWRMRNRRRFERRRLLLLRIEPVRIKQVQPVSHADLRLQ